MSRYRSKAEREYVEAGARLDDARRALLATRGRGRDKVEAAGAKFRAAEVAYTKARAAVEAEFGPHYGRGIPEEDD
jgi:hypothetical protein